MFGDSLTAGFGLPADQSFPAQLERRLRADGTDVRVVDAGRSGDTTAGGLARLDWSLADKPDLVILELGANDMLRGIPPAEVRANLDKMIGKIKASGAKLLLVGMRASPNWGENYQKEFDRIYPELATHTGWRFIRSFSTVSRWIRHSISRTVSTRTARRRPDYRAYRAARRRSARRSS